MIDNPTGSSSNDPSFGPREQPNKPPFRAIETPNGSRKPHRQSSSFFKHFRFSSGGTSVAVGTGAGTRTRTRTRTRTDAGNANANSNSNTGNESNPFPENSGPKLNTLTNRKEFLHSLTNHFRDDLVEESYQLYTSRDELSRAQYIVLAVMISHVLIFVTVKYGHNSAEVIPTAPISLAGWSQWFYCIPAVLFALLPLHYFEGKNQFRSLVYLVRRRWKRWAAFIILTSTIGIQLWITSYAREITETYSENIENSIECAAQVSDAQQRKWGSYLNGSNDLVQFLTDRNRWINIEFVTAIASFLTVISATLSISLRLDFPHVVFTVLMTCGALWVILFLYRMDQWKLGSFDDAFANVLIFFLVIVPASFVVLATYSSDRTRRSGFLRRLQIEKENNELRSNICAMKEALTNHSITSSQHMAIEHTLKSFENAFLDEVSIPFKQLNLERILGSGSQGETLLADFLGTKVAVKRLNRRLLTEKALRSLKEHLELIACLRHPNIVQFIGISYDDYANVCLVTEYMEKGDVYSLLRSDMNLTWSDPLLKIATDTAQGMCYLHQCDPPVVHRDLKSLNLLCSTTFGCKVSDFGESKAMNTDELLKTVVGTPYWLAPEILRGEPYDTKADCYSFGIVLVELETRHAPYYNHQDFSENPIEYMLQIAHGQLRPMLPSSCLFHRCFLIEKCLAANAKDRPSMSEILRYLQGPIKQEIFNRDLDRHTVPRGKILRRQNRMNGKMFEEMLKVEYQYESSTE